MFSFFKKKDLVADYILVKNIVEILEKNNIKTMKKLGKLNYASLLKIYGIGKAKAFGIVSWLYYYQEFKDSTLSYSTYYDFCLNLYLDVSCSNDFRYERHYPQYLYFIKRKKRANRS
jgi:hypothetical protein